MKRIIVLLMMLINKEMLTNDKDLFTIRSDYL